MAHSVSVTEKTISMAELSPEKWLESKPRIQRLGAIQDPFACFGSFAVHSAFFEFFVVGFPTPIPILFILSKILRVFVVHPMLPGALPGLNALEP
jgi:hypothetical protein